MRRTLQFVLLVMLTAACALPLWADIGPRPPLTERDVPNPGEFLTMKGEVVNVQIKGTKAHVVADFHFESVPLRRALLRMRVGFPRLRADKPYANFKVLQNVDGAALAPQEIQGDHRPAPQFAAGLDADWVSWLVRLSGSNGAPMKCKVDSRVSYDQELSRVPGSRNLRFTYVLRSGAGWKDKIGSAALAVTTDRPRLVSATPAGSKRQGNTVSWNLKDFKPTQDVTVVLKP